MWKQENKHAPATIGLPLPNEMLEDVCNADTAEKMFSYFSSVLQRHILFDGWRARGKSQTSEMRANEQMFSHTYRGKQLTSNLKSVEVETEDYNINIATRNGSVHSTKTPSQLSAHWRTTADYLTLKMLRVASRKRKSVVVWKGKIMKTLIWLNIFCVKSIVEELHLHLYTGRDKII